MSPSALPLSLRLYRLATAAASPLAPALLRARARRGKEDGARLGERLGRPSAARPAGPLVWLHAASVGESLSLLPLIERLRCERPDATPLITTGTRTAAELVARRVAAGAIHQYAPVDTPGAAAGFLNHWRPDLGVFAESELWPNLILDAHRRGAKLALVSARITEKTARGWSRDRGAARTLLGAFDLILAQDEASAVRIEDLGGRVSGMLNLKLTAPPLEADAGALASLRQAVGGRPVVLGASTHAREEALIAGAMRRLSASAGLLILAPRHPERGAEVAEALRADGWNTARRSLGEAIGAQTAAYVADTLGELGLFFRLADVAVMGGSFFGGVGGHNPLEPARLGTPVIVGEDVANFGEVYAQMFASGAARQVKDEAAIAGQLDLLLADPQQLRRMGGAGRALAEAATGGLDRAWLRLAPLMPPAAS